MEALFVSSNANQTHKEDLEILRKNKSGPINFFFFFKNKKGDLFRVCPDIEGVYFTKAEETSFEIKESYKNLSLNKVFIIEAIPMKQKDKAALIYRGEFVLTDHSETLAKDIDNFNKLFRKFIEADEFV